MSYTVESLMENAREYLRDFPRHFTATVPVTGSSVRTIDLPHDNVSQGGLAVWSTDGTTTVDGVHASDGSADVDHFTYALDERNGLLRVMAPPTGDPDADPDPIPPGFPANSYINVEGYHYEWLTDKTLKYYVTNVIAEHSFHKPNWNLTTVSDVEADVIALGAAVEAMYGLLVEYSRDIDISTPEAVSMALSQRFRQVQALLFGPTGLIGRYKEKAAMLGIGLDRVEVMTMRRVSRATGRLVPVYKNREFDDISRPKRMFGDSDIQGSYAPPLDFKPGRKILSYVDTEGLVYPPLGDPEP